MAQAIVWQQMDAVVGEHGYAPLKLRPAFVFQNLLVCHLDTAAMRATGINRLTAGGWCHSSPRSQGRADPHC